MQVELAITHNQGHSRYTCQPAVLLFKVGLPLAQLPAKGGNEGLQLLHNRHTAILQTSGLTIGMVPLLDVSLLPAPPNRHPIYSPSAPGDSTGTWLG